MMIYHSKLSILFFIMLLGYGCVSCDDIKTPKPMGYFRIDLPVKEYKMVRDSLPFSCNIPKYAKIFEIADSLDDTQWFNIEMPKFKATIHLSYYNINRPLINYIETSRDFVYKHMNKASSIETTEIVIPDNNVYGLVYYINGNETASTLQFYVTDSLKQFMRGALYFDHKPNNDSIAPVIDYINEDILTLVRTLKWNN